MNEKTRSSCLLALAALQVLFILGLSQRLRWAEKNTRLLYQSHAQLQTNVSTLDQAVLQLQAIAIQRATNQYEINVEVPIPRAWVEPRPAGRQAATDTEL